MYITGSLYAKYYFALRTVSMHEGSSGSTRSRRSGSGFRQHYNYMVTKDVVQMKGLEVLIEVFIFVFFCTHIKFC